MTPVFDGVTEGEADCWSCGKPVIFGSSNFFYHVFVEDREACPGFIERRAFRLQRERERG